MEDVGCQQRPSRSSVEQTNRARAVMIIITTVCVVYEPGPRVQSTAE